VPARNEMVGQLIATAAGSDDPKVFESILVAIAPAENQSFALWQLTALASLQEALDHKKLSLDSFTNSTEAPVRQAAQQIQTALKDVEKIARNKKATLSEREAALRLLAWNSDEKNLRTLIEFATQIENIKLQKAAQNSLRSQRHPKLAEILMSGWNNFPVAVRSSILEILLSRDEGIQKVFDAIEQQKIKPAEISLGSRQLLLKHDNKKIRERAAALFPQNKNRQAILAKFSEEVPQLIGNPDKGAEVFSRLCANCHSFRGQGFAVGPDLMALGDKSPQDFLVAILDPSSVIEPRYLQFNIETKNEQSLSGVIQAETASSITLVQGGGVREKILRADIAEIKASSLSLMPEGLEEGHKAQDFADLIAYLKARPAAFGSATTEQAAEARKKFLKGTNNFYRVISSSEKQDYPGWLGTLPLAHCRQTNEQSKLIWETAPLPEEIKREQIYNFRVPAAMGLISQPAGKFHFKLNGKTILDFDVTLSDRVWQSSNSKISLRYQVMENNSEDSNGILTIGVRGELLVTNKPARFEVVSASASSQRWFGIYALDQGDGRAR
ncbi:MAG: c-type cytochrome, partial [Verrucomicrobiota bacterium]|nr:c-type cytochrome [Verrucomicrobiota bacterium]